MNRFFSWAREVKMVYQVKGPLFRQLIPSMISITLITTFLCIIKLHFKIITINIPASMPGLLGVVLGLLLVFRNNTAYERWWEGRKILGALVNTSRNFSLQIHTLLPEDRRDEQNHFQALLLAFVYALKEHLREGVKMTELKFLDAESYARVNASDHKPTAIVQLLLLHIHSLYEKALVTDFQMLKLMENTDELVDHLGKCERIRNTPMPVSHNILLKFLVFVYVLVLPFALIAELQWWSILVVLVIYYFMMTLVMVAEEIEDPFGSDPNDLPVDQIASNIQNNIREIFTFPEDEPKAKSRL